MKCENTGERSIQNSIAACFINPILSANIVLHIAINNTLLIRDIYLQWCENQMLASGGLAVNMYHRVCGAGWWRKAVS